VVGRCWASTTIERTRGLVLRAGTERALLVRARWNIRARATRVVGTHGTGEVAVLREAARVSTAGLNHWGEFGAIVRSGKTALMSRGANVVRSGSATLSYARVGHHRHIGSDSGQHFLV
jgi:hypothetical protein